ncbi:microcystinase C [Azorhizobium oxalatiphilum]|uniref:Microcystinase C n=1 Tax=Azorhizobium oxalatiphilum TaxID=980631 RepID=A0A917C6R4_9HYPH|nr:M81 family metallopeptidase [Azorhizobium oxalatiphilum]GGF70645.1 microcystinase C [Azorhizobium oxalatiphilum]
MPRIAVAGFMHETNTFAPAPAGYAAFEHGGGFPPFSRGEEIFARMPGKNTGLSGFIAAAAEKGWEVLPTLWCAAAPSAHVTEDAFERIMAEMLERMAALGPVDAVYLDLHGAMVTTHLDDGEGETEARVRALIGPDVPLVVSLDLHGNLTPRMVAEADALVAYRTYPHVDMADTGRRAADVLEARLAVGKPFAKAFRQIPFLMPIAWQCTEMEPCRTLYAQLAEIERDMGLVHLSFLPGFPAADFADCGGSVVAYADTQTKADAGADALTALINAQEDAFAGSAFSPEDGVRKAMALAATASRPVVISDTQDNPGAGGSSDTTGMLRALLACGAERAALGLMVDPETAEAAHKAGVGAEVTLKLGGKSGIPDDAPFEGTFVVEALSEGTFDATGPYFGKGPMFLGRSACLRIGGVRVVVASRKAQLADQAMFRYVGIEPTEQAILVNKSSVHFRADFTPIAETILVCTAPGAMPLSPASLPWKHLRPGVRLEPNGRSFA